MAEIRLTPEVPTAGGLDATYYSSSTTPALTTGDFTPTGDQFLVANDGNTMLHVKNGGTPVNVTVQTPVIVDGLALPDRTVAVPANEERFIRPRDRTAYGDPFKFALDDVTNVEIAVIRVN